MTDLTAVDHAALVLALACRLAGSSTPGPAGSWPPAPIGKSHEHRLR